MWVLMPLKTRLDVTLLSKFLQEFYHTFEPTERFSREGDVIAILEPCIFNRVGEVKLKQAARTNGATGNNIAALEGGTQRRVRDNFSEGIMNTVEVASRKHLAIDGGRQRNVIVVPARAWSGA